MEKIYKRFVNITESKVIEKHNINHKCRIKPKGNFFVINARENANATAVVGYCDIFLGQLFTLFILCAKKRA